MPGTSPPGTGLRRSLSVWQAIGLSIALMAPSMAANINPQASAATAGRAVPLAFLIAAVGVLLVAYTFVRLCQSFSPLFLAVVFGFLSFAGFEAAATLGEEATHPWQAVVPLMALVVLGYTLYRNVIPYPPSGPGRWFPVVAGGWLVVALIAVIVAPGFARRLGAALTASEGIAAPEPATTAPTELPAEDAAGDQRPRA